MGMLVGPAASASSITYWMMGLSTRGSISLGCALVAGRKRVPSPAAGKTAFRIRGMIGCYHSLARGRAVLSSPVAEGVVLDLRWVVENREAVLAMLRSRGQSLEQIQAWPGLEGVDP